MRMFQNNFRACLIRLLTYIYIDDHPHIFLKLNRCFRANRSVDKYLHELPFERSEFLSSDNLEKLFMFILDYFYAFAKEERGASSVQAFEMELVRCCKFMLKFGIYTHRNNQVNINDLADLFNFICYILDIFINRKDFISVQDLDTIIHKDQIIDDYTQNNPIQKAVFDIKYRLLNKRDWINSTTGEAESVHSFREASIHSKILHEIVDTLHFMIDFRQFFLMSNIVEMFHKKTIRKRDPKYFESLPEKSKTSIITSLIKNFK
jgi:hypothetical protein